MFLLLAAISVGAGLAGIAIGGFVYTRPRAVWTRFQEGFGTLWETWGDAYRVDDLYGATIVRPGRLAAEAAAFKIDLPIVDGIVNGVARVFKETGSRGRVVQTGYVRNYGAGFIGGLLLVVIWLLTAGAS